MKNKLKVLGIIAIVAVFTLSAATCFSQSGGGKIVNNAEELKAYIDSQPANKPDKPIKVAMNAKDIIFSKISTVIMSSGKYVSLDLSGSPITTIPNRAFYDENTNKGCETLVSIIIPNSVTSIEAQAFAVCTKLTSVTIPKSVTRIGSAAFSGCASLSSVTIPNSVTSIGDYAFNSSGLTNINIPDSVTSIGDNAFARTKLTNVTIPNSVTSIGGLAFSDCVELTAINVNSGNKEYSSDQGVLYNKDKTILLIFPEGKAGKYTIPNSVTTIRSWTFFRRKRLTSVTIHNNVNSIGECAFAGCTSLATINVDAANTAYSSQDGVLYNKNKTTLITYPAGKTGTFTVPNSVTSIDGRAFAECVGITSVTIPNSVTSIGYMNFAQCTGLTNVTIDNGVTSIEMYAFDYCTSLTSIIIPDSITSIGMYAFNCTSLTSVTFQGRITSSNFDNSAFSYFKEGRYQPYDLRTKYLAGGIGTYTRPNSESETWTKQ